MNKVEEDVNKYRQWDKPPRNSWAHEYQMAILLVLPFLVIPFVKGLMPIWGFGVLPLLFWVIFPLLFPPKCPICSKKLKYQGCIDHGSVMYSLYKCRCCDYKFAGVMTD